MTGFQVRALPLAQRIANAIRDGGRIAWSDADAPATIAAASAVQAQVARLQPSPIVAWKTSLPPGQPAVAAPIFAHRFIESGATLTLPPGQPLLLEVELCVRLGRDVPPRPGKPYSTAEIRDAVDALHVGIEICLQRFPDGRPAPFTLELANCLFNGGYVLGPEVPLARLREPPGRHVTILRDGRSVQDAPGAPPMGDALATLAAYLTEPNDALGGIRAGHYVTTGSFNAPLATEGMADFAASLGDLGTVRVALR